MSLALKIVSISFLLVLIFLILHLLKKDKITIKYSIVWLIPCIVLLVFTIIPGFLTWTTRALGFQTASNMVFALLIALLIMIRSVNRNCFHSKKPNEDLNSRSEYIERKK